MRLADARSDISFMRRRIKIAEDGRDERTFELGGFDWPFSRRTFDLWSEKAAAVFDEAFIRSGLGEALDSRLYTVAPPFVLRITDGDDQNIPWEGLQRLVKPENRTKLVPVRIVDPDRPFHYAEIGSAMSCVVLVGHPGADPAFRPDEAEAFLTRTINTAMEASGRAPIVATFQLRSDNLKRIAPAIRDRRPNVVFYFGHGRNVSGPELLLSDTGWVPLSKVAAALFPIADVRPPFWIFWSCSLAEGADQPTARMGSAATLDALSASEAVAVLAMRSRIGVNLARPMLDALIGAFAAGEPLEVAAAYARAAGLSSDAGSAGRMDYAAPAVWTRSEPVEAIRWEPGKEADATWVALPLLGFEGTAPELMTGLAEVDEEAVALAVTWSRPGRYFATAPVAGDVGAEPAARAKFLAAAAALRRMGGRPVIPIVLRTGKTFDQRLRLWAERAVMTIDPRHGDREVTAAIGAIARDGLAGLPRLLAVPNVAVLLSERPDRSAGWEVLNQIAAGVSVVIAGSSVPREAEQGWKLDLLMTDTPRHECLDTAMKVAPLACAILGVVERPLPLHEVADMAGARDADLAGLEPLLVRIGGRRVLGQTARTKLTAELDAAIVAEARRKCIAKLSERPVSEDFEALIEVSRQHLELGQNAAIAEAINAAWLVAGKRWTTAERRRLFALVARSESVRDGLNEEALLAVSRTTVELQETKLARLVLERIAPATALSKMCRHELLAECWKADVASKNSRDRMFEHATEAVTCAEECARMGGDGTVVLHQRHNLARLRQYFDHAYDESLQVYVDIAKAIGAAGVADANAARLVAAGARNSADCLLDPAARPIDGALRDRIEEMLRSGREVAASHGLVGSVADIDFTLARTAEAAHDDDAASGILDGLANGEIGRSYPLIAAIAAMRLHWNDIRRKRIDFEWERFSRLVHVLDLFDHGWAIRTAIRARLRAMKILMARGGAHDAERVRGLIRDNREAVRLHPGLGGRDDTRAAALTEVAADLMEGEGANAWPQFAAGPAAALLPEGWSGRTAAEIWEDED